MSDENPTPEELDAAYLAVQSALQGTSAHDMLMLQDRLAAIDARTARLEAAVDRIERGLIRHGSL